MSNTKAKYTKYDSEGRQIISEEYIDEQIALAKASRKSTWRVIKKAEWEKLHQDGAHYFASVADDTGNLICQCANKNSLETAQKRAEHIVKCVNNHEQNLKRITELEAVITTRAKIGLGDRSTINELVEALRDCIDLLSNPSASGYIPKIILTEAKQALEKASIK